ncbi:MULTISPECIES: pentapeptide repeat-containing protein [Microcystis]|uniref:Pentapeptide repeat family protein n=1 Tax=Microcystis panniformis FACHB-1757 TaxID=1638788 RepID=A0A0K1S628_9CHRO|nr:MULTISPECIES: pentapeptide repeat-containing protein [Microcystis]AKV69510.1 hypothetical protein VL20_4609 [Microcystis panniformis FACHB-1757]TRT70886.1 MAG: pentapeptide repeat-containing protein [Microcystis sp. M_OC_Ca_00000000_S217Cul]TRT84623.1 MAG: pentapeptide repeat-containing protein [Microcystis sp. M_OC_Ca_00000000_C217Col]
MVNKKLEDTPQMPLDEREQHRKRQELITPFRPSQRWRLFLWQIWRWTGFGEKKLWDLLQLVIIPLVLWGLSSWFNQQATIREQTAAKEADQQKALASYIENLPDLLQKKDIDMKLRQSLVQAKTNVTLGLLKGDPHRQGVLFGFLRESSLLGTPSDTGSPRTINPILQGIRLNEMDLQSAPLHDANLTRADLSKSNLAFASLNRTNLSSANLSRSRLTRANLVNANLRGAWLIEADLRGADLRGANLINVKLDRSIINQETKFEDAFYKGEEDIKSYKVCITDNQEDSIDHDKVCTGNNLVSLKEFWEKQGVILVQPELTKEQLPTPEFFRSVDLSGVNLTRSRLSEVDFSGANLSEANFTNATLTKVKFVKANLMGADLTGANLTGANLTGANLTGAKGIGNQDEKLKQATLCNTTLANGKMYKCFVKKQ